MQRKQIRKIRHILYNLKSGTGCVLSGPDQFGIEKGAALPYPFFDTEVS